MFVGSVGSDVPVRSVGCIDTDESVRLLGRAGSFDLLDPMDLLETVGV